jgi:ABC-type branched-subunit amino acid transport system ATPase component
MTASAALLQVRGLSRRFGGLQAVADLSFDAREGEVLGVIGPNGAGKSTTFNMIAGALVPSAGSIQFDGRSLAGLPTHAFAARGIMRTFQHNKPFPSMTLLENVSVGMHTRIGCTLWQVIGATPSARQAEAQCRARAAEMIDFVGLGDWLEADVSTLSFGQGRLLEIARALAGSPRLLLFDEPAAGLSPAECARLGEVIRAIASRNIAVLLIEHDMRFLMSLADRVVVLNFGRRIAEGTPEQIRADPAVVEAYLGDLGALARA